MLEYDSQYNTHDRWRFKGDILTRRYHRLSTTYYSFASRLTPFFAYKLASFIFFLLAAIINFIPVQYHS